MLAGLNCIPFETRVLFQLATFFNSFNRFFYGFTVLIKVKSYVIIFNTSYYVLRTFLKFTRVICSRVNYNCINVKIKNTHFIHNTIALLKHS